jgi:hypothetical protein
MMITEWWIEKDLEGSRHGAGLCADIWTQDIQNSEQECYTLDHEAQTGSVTFAETDAVATYP